MARAVAERLGFAYLDTGAMYRAVALAAAQRDRSAAEVAEEIGLDVGERALLDGRDVTDAIRTPEVSAGASRVAAEPASPFRLPEVRGLGGRPVPRGRSVSAASWRVIGHEA